MASLSRLVHVGPLFTLFVIFFCYMISVVNSPKQDNSTRKTRREQTRRGKLAAEQTRRRTNSPQNKLAARQTRREKCEKHVRFTLSQGLGMLVNQRKLSCNPHGYAGVERRCKFYVQSLITLI